LIALCIAVIARIVEGKKRGKFELSTA